MAFITYTPTITMMYAPLSSYMDHNAVLQMFWRDVDPDIRTYFEPCHQSMFLCILAVVRNEDNIDYINPVYKERVADLMMNYTEEDFANFIHNPESSAFYPFSPYQAL